MDPFVIIPSFFLKKGKGILFKSGVSVVVDSSPVVAPMFYVNFVLVLVFLISFLFARKKREMVALL